MIVGVQWGGWVTGDRGGNRRVKMGKRFGEDAVVRRLAPLCVFKSKQMRGDRTLKGG